MTNITRHHKRKPRIIRVQLSLFVFLLAFISVNTSYAAVHAIASGTTPLESVSQKLRIYEIKQGKNTTPGQPVEYVTLYNPNDTPISIFDWNLEYAKSGFTKCSATSWFGDGTSSLVKRTIISGTGVAGEYSTTVAAHALSSEIPLAITDSAAGSVRITDTTGNTHDLVGWKYGSINPPCSNGEAAASLSADKSLQRYIACDSSEPANTDRNDQDFFVADVSAGNALGLTPLPSCLINAPDDMSASATACQGITLSEILPNPAGTDTSHEFIELFNATDQPASLINCAIQYGDEGTVNGKMYVFTASDTIPAHSYQAFSDTQTKLSLTNSKPGTIWLLALNDPSNPVEISSTTYPANLDDDVGWAYDDTNDSWIATYTLTPGAANILTTSAPCPTGQVHNPETNRCISESTTSGGTAAAKTSTSALTPCAVNQTRNPETNRCRNNTTIAATSPTPCKPGQERNPETNRCKAATSTTSAAKSCPTGQERNPDTNRCRKIPPVSAGNTLNTVHDIASEAKAAKHYLLIGSLALAAAIAYGVYEWRHEIVELCRKLSKKSLPPQQPLTTDAI